MTTKFIILEGIDGSGKTATANEMKNILESQGKKVFLTSEPRGTNFGNAVHNIVVNYKDKLSNEIIAELYIKAILHNLEDNIKPAIEKGEIVICDRSFMSTIVYQDICDSNTINTIQFAIQNSINPEWNAKMFLLNIDPKIALEQIHARAGLNVKKEIKQDPFCFGAFPSQFVKQLPKEEEGTTLESLTKLSLDYKDCFDDIRTFGISNFVIDTIDTAKGSKIPIEWATPSQVAKHILKTAGFEL